VFYLSPRHAVESQFVRLTRVSLGELFAAPHREKCRFDLPGAFWGHISSGSVSRQQFGRLGNIDGLGGAQNLNSASAVSRLPPGQTSSSQTERRRGASLSPQLVCQTPAASRSMSFPVRPLARGDFSPYHTRKSVVLTLLGAFWGSLKSKFWKVSQNVLILITETLDLRHFPPDQLQMFFRWILGDVQGPKNE